mmetsp:Transcript_21413/g.46747  ORF Transcript_21413/g.46747 Transcript_21413/m.46747 type:complete len:230 (+) Transcript_21413:1770-2459(+)
MTNVRLVLACSASQSWCLRRHCVGPLFRKLVVHVVDVNGMNLDVSILGHVIQIVDSTRGGIAMGGMIDGSLTQIDGLFHRQIVSVVIVENTVSVGRTTAYGKHLSLQSGAVIVNVVQLWTLLVPSGNHGTHRQTISTVGSHDIGQEFGCRCHRDSATVSELKQTTFHTKVAFPKGTIGGTTCHGSQQERVDFDHLFDGSRRDVGSHGRTRIDTDDYTTLELESEGCCSL